MSNTERQRKEEYERKKTVKFFVYMILVGVTLFVLNWMMDAHLEAQAAASRPVLSESRN